MLGEVTGMAVFVSTSAHMAPNSVGIVPHMAPNSVGIVPQLSTPIIQRRWL